ncbi:hypothetical protein F4861DRAFT_178185 [Xylaria intraflava]|nr:hypothetical protein F4861DRAFT_178185 [Xylaria intraflava]
MATLDSLAHALRQSAMSTTAVALSDAQYRDGFDFFLHGPGWTAYQSFVFPQLSQLLAPLFNSRVCISVLEIGPGPKSILGSLPRHLSRKINRYAAFEPNHLFATKLEEWLGSPSDTESPLPGLESPPEIQRTPFNGEHNTVAGSAASRGDDDGKFDVILFCHSMYEMNPQRKFIEQALDMLVTEPEGGMVVVFHREGALHIDGLVCHQTASFPTEIVSVENKDEVVDQFARFIACFDTQDEAIRAEWRKICRSLACYEKAFPDRLLFDSADIMVVFNQHAATLPELTAQVPVVKVDETVKNREALIRRPASIVRPTEIRHIQRCVQWAVKHKVGLTIIDGSHSDHSIRPNVVSLDMGAFDQLYILPGGADGGTSDLEPGSLIVAEAGCKSGDIIRKGLAEGLTVPLGTCPDVGVGLWLQGGIGHLARLHGLTCDSIVGAVIVGVESGQVFYVGCVPSQHRPADAVRPENEEDLLWAIKGSAANFGIVVSVTFKAYAAPTYSVRNWTIPMSDSLGARRRLRDFDELIASKLPRNCSADAFLYWDTDQLHLGVTMFESTTTSIGETPMPTPTMVHEILGPEKSFKTVHRVDSFENEMYISGMHGGHGGGKTSSFRRTVFLKGIGLANVAGILVATIEARPSPFCYLHLLHGGGAVSDVAPDAAAFGCRDWDFACVITGVWPRDQDGTGVARAAVKWVYDTATKLLPLSRGAYGADLGLDPRDAALAAKAFGPNLPRLASLKRQLDPYNVLSYACPLPMEQKLIILVMGESCAGKDYCANIWASVFNTCARKNLTARVVSISDATKREYAAATGADLDRLLQDHAYKEQHRSAMIAFFEDQARRRPQLAEEHFLNIVYGATDVDVLLITGIRDDAQVAGLSHLVPESRLLDIRIIASEETRRVRGGCHGAEDYGNEQVDDAKDKNGNNSKANSMSLDYRPSLVFDNTIPGNEAAEDFAKHYLLPYVHEDIQRLANMVRLVPGFPRPDVEFRHVLNIAQQPGGLAMCTSLLQTHFTGDWTKIEAVVSCEAGGFIYASPLAERVNAPLVIIREAGKLPPPTISVSRSPSHISSSSKDPRELKIEMDRDAIPGGASVVVVDDVLATGKTLCAVLRLLQGAGIGAEHVNVMVVAEFPVHRGRELLRQHGFGRVNIQTLLVFSGV